MQNQNKQYKYKKECEHPKCDTVFQTNVPQKRFCSNVCSNRWHSIERWKSGKAQKWNRPNPQRYCKECNIPIQKGIHRCDPCKKELEHLWNKNQRPLHNGFTREQETEFMQQCVSSGIDTTGLIQKEYKRIGKKSRSKNWIINRLKELGLYKKPDMNRSIQIRDRELREQTYKTISDLGFTLHTDNIKRKDIKVKCNECNTIINWYTMYRLGCNVCKTKQRIEERTKNEIEIRDNKNSARIKEYTSRIETLKEFIHSDRYKEYNSWKETPVIKEYTFYNSISGIECRDKELTYKIQWINYYHYKNSGVCPDKPIKKGYKICNVCVEHKPIKEFNTNSKASSQCKECAKIYRREHLAPIEREKMKEKYKNDPVFKLDRICRTHLYGALKGKKKSKKRIDIIGLTPIELKQYIEDRFESWMSWDNWGIGQGMWQVQHIIPRDFAINENEIYLINHYKNLIPMCATANGILKNRILVEQLNEWHNTDKGIQKIIKRNKSNIITEWELKRVLPIIVREIDTNKIKQSEQKLTKWFAYE